MFQKENSVNNKALFEFKNKIKFYILTKELEDKTFRLSISYNVWKIKTWKIGIPLGITDRENRGEKMYQRNKVIPRIEEYEFSN